MLFASLPPADRRALSEMMSRVFNPLANPVMGVMGQSAGPYGQRNSTIQLPKDVFLAKITDVSGTGFAALYSFVEMQIKPDGTGLEETFNGRVAICCAGSGSDLAIRPARYILDDTLTENTLVLARVSIAESNEFEILGVLDGTGGGGISTGGCSGKLGWTIDTASLIFSDPANEIFPRAMSVAVLESFGRCDCVAAPAGDAPTIRFFQALEDGLPDPFAELEPQPGDTRVIARWDEVSKWEGLGTLATCCGGCSNFTFEIDTVATLLLERPVFTMTVNGGCTDGSGTPSPKSFTLWVECGNDRYVVLAGFDTQACEFDVTDSQCVNLFRIGLVCIPCNVPAVGCPACREKIAPPFYRVEINSRTFYLSSTGGDCSCSWADACSGATYSVSTGELVLTLPSPYPVYSADVSDQPQGPACSSAILTRVGESEVYPETVTLYGPGCRPLPETCCGRVLPLRVQIAFEWTPGTPTEIISTTCLNDEGELWSNYLEWSDEAYEDPIMPGTFYGGYVGNFIVDGDTYPVIYLPCYGASEGASLFISAIEYTTTIDCDDLTANFGQLGLCTGVYDPIDTSVNLVVRNVTEYWWCVDDGDGNFSCVQSDTEPAGATGPAQSSQANCEAACACEGGSGSGGGIMPLMASAPVAMRGTTRLPTVVATPTKKPPPATRRYVPLPMARCPYLGDLLTPCTSCGGAKPERDVYACDHPDNDDGRCTKGDPGKFGEWTCGTCDRHPSKIASREWPSPIDTRHLLFHIAPVAFNNGEAWRWNVEQVRRRQHLFNGRKVAAVLTPGNGFSLDSGMVVQSERWNLDSADAVREALGDGWDVIEMPNDPKLREVATWVPLWSRLEEFALPGHAAFYCHSKGVTRTAPQIREWTRILYESNLDFLDRVDALLAAYPIVGPFKKVGRGWAAKDTASAWHFSGTFMHVRLQDFFRRDWKRVDPFWSGTEAWPGVAYDATEAGCLFHEGKVETMNLYSPKYIAAVATEFDAWKNPSAK